MLSPKAGDEVEMDSSRVDDSLAEEVQQQHDGERDHCPWRRTVRTSVGLPPSEARVPTAARSKGAFPQLHRRRAIPERYGQLIG